MKKKENKDWMPAKMEPLMKDIVSFKNAMDKMVDSFFTEHPTLKKLPSIWMEKLTQWRPEIDMYETDKDVIVRASVPGCDKKDIKIHVADNILVVFGEKKEEKEVRKKDFYHREQRFGSFQRSITLPYYANAAKAKASCEKGVLTVTFPKIKAAKGKGKNIDIS